MNPFTAQQGVKAGIYPTGRSKSLPRWLRRLRERVRVLGGGEGDLTPTVTAARPRLWRLRYRSLLALQRKPFNQVPMSSGVKSRRVAALIWRSKPPGFTGLLMGTPWPRF